VPWAGLAILLASMFSWFSKIVAEAKAGDHTPWFSFTSVTA
jgi:cytochrome c oxidase subunit 3